MTLAGICPLSDLLGDAFRLSNAKSKQEPTMSSESGRLGLVQPGCRCVVRWAVEGDRRLRASSGGRAGVRQKSWDVG